MVLWCSKPIGAVDFRGCGYGTPGHVFNFTPASKQKMIQTAAQTQTFSLKSSGFSANVLLSLAPLLCSSEGEDATTFSRSSYENPQAVMNAEVCVSSVSVMRVYLFGASLLIFSPNPSRGAAVCQCQTSCWELWECVMKWILFIFGLLSWKS